MLDDFEVEMDTRINELNEEVAALLSDYKSLRTIHRNLETVVAEQQELTVLDINPSFYNYTGVTKKSKQI